MTRPAPRNKTILLIEDEDHDVMFMELALQRAEVAHPLQVARDGREAIAYLKGDGKFSNRKEYPLPGLVLLDWQLPHLPGSEVLKWIRQQHAFVRLPVLVLTSSNQDADVEAAYRLGANAFIVKPSYSELQDLLRRIKRYWLEMDEPPPNCKEWLAAVIPPPHPG